MPGLPPALGLGFLICPCRSLFLGLLGATESALKLAHVLPETHPSTSDGRSHPDAAGLLELSLEERERRLRLARDLSAGHFLLCGPHPVEMMSRMETSDGRMDLLERARQGERGALLQLLALERDGLTAHVRRRLGPHHRERVGGWVCPAHIGARLTRPQAFHGSVV